MDKVKCYYCNKIKKEMTFCIGASTKPEWTMHAGTGKMSCPKCYELARDEAKTAIHSHSKSSN